MRNVKRLALLFSFVFVLPLLALAADELLISAKQQLDNGNPQAAYNLLVPLQSERAGDPEYDFLLGSAALGIGKNTEAVFALERVLAVLPNSAPARALIARAYFNLKEIETAKREFENVKKQQIPPEVTATIDRFLDAIARVEASQRVTLRGYFQFGFGYDSNVNSGPADSQVAVPAAGGLLFTLAPTATKLHDSFLTFGGGLNLVAPLTRTLSIFGGLAYNNQTNFNEDKFSTYYYDANLGLSYRVGREAFTVAGQYNSFYVDDVANYHDAYRNASGVTAQWQHDFDARNQLSAFAQYAELIYPSQGVRDADRYVGGFGFAHAFAGNGPIIYVGAYGGEEKEKNESFPFVGDKLYGARIGGQHFLSEKYSIFLNGSVEKRRYNGDDPFFLVRREDTQYTASAGLRFVPTKNVSLTPQVSWTDNESNIPINQFDRTVVSIVFRRDI
jgi:tetratricopeptide (TPR) repeat protein